MAESPRPPRSTARDSKPKTATRTENSHVKLVVKRDKEEDVIFKVKRDLPLHRLMRMYCEKKGLAYGTVRFIFDGVRLKESSTPEDILMEDGDTIDACSEQFGG